MSIHFYYSGKIAPERITAWDPEADPMRFPNAEGHAFFQLYLVLKAHGVAVTLGKDIAPDAQVIVVFKKAKLRFADQWRLLKALWHSEYQLPIVLIAADCKSGRMNVFTYHVEVVANVLRQVANSDIFIPLLPQNALIKRKPETWDGTVGVYCHSKNFPAHLLDEAFLAELAKRGIKLQTAFLDSEAPEKLTDFSGISLSLCLRGKHESENERKPPTKVINAWNAQVIPVIDREAGYLSVATPDVDCILLQSDHLQDATTAQQELLEICEAYRDREHAENMLQQVYQRSMEFSREAIVNKYIGLFETLVSTRRRNDARQRLAAVLAFCLRPFPCLARKIPSLVSDLEIDIRPLRA